MAVKDKIVSLKAATSVLLARSRLANRVGKTFEGNRDLYKYLGYSRNLSFDDYHQRYFRGGIAGRIVDVYPQATWRAAPRLFETGTQEEEEKSEFVVTFEGLVKRIRLYHYLERTDKIAGIGRYAVLLIGVKGGRSLKEPVGRLASPEDVLFLAPYSEGNAEILSYDTEPSSPRFGLPLMYQINLTRDLSLGASIGTFSTKSVEVHHSRVLHVSEGLLEDEIFGIPRMHRVWNYLDDLDKIVGGSAEAVWRTVDRGIQFNIDDDIDLTEQDEEDFTQEIEEYVNNLKRYIKTRGVEAKVLGSDTIDATGPFDSTLSLISGVTGVPQRMLTGSERGQLASDADERNFAARVKERQQSFAEPVLLRPFLEWLAGTGAITLPEPGYYFKWPDIATLTARERADVAARYAQAIKNVSTQTKESEPVMSPEDFRKRFIDEGA